MKFFLLSKIIRFWPIVALIIVVLVLAITNYKSGTYLMGWDNFQTDLNPLLGVKRSLFSVWEDFQSFGLVAGMAHAADFVHTMSILLLSYILPQPLIRYTFMFLMILAGGCGMYQLLEFLGFSGNKRTFAFAGSLFYIFNFYSIQIMSLPFEPFSVFFGMLPWEVLIFLKFFHSQSRKNLFFLIIINILATPQSTLQQLFVVYILLLGALTLGEYVKSRKISHIKSGVIALGIIVLVNSFWILPQVYFLHTSSAVIKQSKINQLSTNDVLYSNSDKGNISDLATFTGFYYELLDKQQQPLFAPWQNQRQLPGVVISFYILFLVVLLGLFSKQRYMISFSLIFLLTLIALLSNTFPFNLINIIIRGNDFINQIFRSPFTKFGVAYAFVTSYLFCCGLSFIANHLRTLIPKTNIIVSTFFLGILFFQCYPAFQGNYIASEMKVKIPDQYFQAMSYFEHIDKNQRIALLPDYTFWGWFYHSWGYDGSGFLWYGIEQPIISRTFDVWSTKSESYYWEEKTALEAEDAAQFQNLLEKYGIDYLFYDKSLLPVVASTKAIQYDSLDHLLSHAQFLTLEKKWGSISLYKVHHKKTVQNFVWAATNIPNIGPSVTLTNNDIAYKTYGDYISNSNALFNNYFPFLDLTSQTDLKEKTWSIFESYTNWQIQRPVSFDTSTYKLSPAAGTVSFPLFSQGQEIHYTVPFIATKTIHSIDIEFPKVLLSSFNGSDTSVLNCTNKGSNLVKIKNSQLIIESKSGAIGCFQYSDPNLDQHFGYLIKIDSKNIQGQPLYFYVLDQTKAQAYIEERIPNGTSYYFIAPHFQYGTGYNFIFQNTSYNTLPAVNSLSSLTIYLIPYSLIQQLELYTEKPVYSAIPISNVEVQKLNYYSYDIHLKQNLPSNSYLILNQSNSPGWVAFQINDNMFYTKTIPFIFGKQINTHVNVNNWANGWKIGSNQTHILLLFWPQYLEYAGIVIMLLVFIVAFVLFLRGQRN